MLLLPGVRQRIPGLELVIRQQASSPTVQIIRQFIGLARLRVKPIDSSLPQRKLIPKEILRKKEKAPREFFVGVTPEIRPVPSEQIIPVLNGAGGIQMEGTLKGKKAVL